MTIVIVGLGPGRVEMLTREAWDVLTQAQVIYARTGEHPVLAHFEGKVHAFDYVYAAKRTFSEVYESIAREIVTLAQAGEDVVFAVPGHPRVGEATTPRIESLASEARIPVRIVEGVSFVEVVCNAVGIDPLDGLNVYDAMLVGQEYFPTINTDKPLLLGQLYSKALASDVKLTLLSAYPPDHPVTLVRGAGTEDVNILTVPLHELDRQSGFDHMTTLVVRPWEHPSAYETLQNVVNHLRSPEGCPWDRKQTHQSLRRHLLAETYEVLDALDRDDMVALQEELGDLLLQIALHVAIASEGGEFLLGDVIGQHVEKLIRRHPHVFGDVRVDSAEEVVQNWEAIKKAEKASRGESDPFASIPQALPALMRAAAVAARGHWHEEPPPPGVDAERLSGLSPEALGDLLFWLSAWAKSQGWDAEMLLREAIQRWIHLRREGNETRA